ncbi:MAG: PhzF family phenazine biosynthesis protein [Arthrobacter sp.]|uniref:PhzF family phenazine biosynthesis protein n=1 Tax=unclassified Arthrobacter TaxID=235627 RepID=UPI002655B8AF|nr:PhzF family phenazine biosynthesis protein [Micrococcaceae bacterium]MDN5813685.1 PhzF family phenazine biosynthesis protein [Micrococcaceae bacterium]MDN5824719.1 PhzF family phenazine biosynthesis protein [Micrococcaceae bacterium]MDN5878613.1 PhzF family phenazine biosynthesis protein [Micrococcaceae bacterium]MDN5886174.1 PhzF family phenazine biosynthesis protein [Micrococcaceae bacterium]
MPQRQFRQVDVFTSTPYLGNALAVVLDADGLDEEAMLRFANWTNLAETTFVLPPTDPSADYRVRIFTTTTELPFAGHPTLGTAHAWLEAGGRPRRPGVVIQECAAGLIEVHTGDRDGQGRHQLAFLSPPLRRTGPLEDDVLEWALAGLGLRAADVVAHQWVANGPQWAVLMLHDAEAVLAVEPDFVALEGLEIGIIGPHLVPAVEAVPAARRDGERPKGTRAELEPLLPADDSAAFETAVRPIPADFEVRAFCPGEGMPEDPVTGSLNAGIAQWMIPAGLVAPSYTVRQGTRLGRAGHVGLSEHDGGIRVSGDVVTCIEGTVCWD